MVRRVILGGLLLLGLVGGLAAQDFSLAAGGGFVFSLPSDTYTWDYNRTILGNPVRYAGTQTTDYEVLGVAGFFDFTYGVVSVGFSTTPGEARVRSVNTSPNTDSNAWRYSPAATWLNLGLAAKFPFDLGSRVKLFPLVGIEAAINLGYRDKSDLDPVAQADLSDAYLLLGAGLDIPLSGSIFLRPVLDLGINLSSAPSNPATDGTYRWSGLRLDIACSLGTRL